MKYLLSLLLLLSASVFVSCEKDEDKTPRPTPRTEKELLEEYRARYPQLDLSTKADQRDDSQKQKCTKQSTALRGCFMSNEKLKQMALWSPIWAGSAIHMVV